MSFREYTDLERIAALETDTQNIKNDIHEIKNKVNDMHNAFMQAKGARLMFILFWMFIGGALSSVNSLFSYFKPH